MKVFLTGSTGFIGGAILKQLTACASVEHVYCLARGGGHSSTDRVTFIRGDVVSAEWHTQVTDVDVVIHAAGNASFGSRGNHEVNYDGTVLLVEFARKARAAKFIFFSTIGAVDRSAGDLANEPLHDCSVPAPTSRYGKSKLQAEHAVRESGLSWTIIRPAWVYGPGMRLNSHLCRLAAMTRQRSLPSLFNWPGRVSVIHVDDLSRGVLRIAVDGGATNRTLYAATETLSIGEIFQAFGEALGVDRSGAMSLPWGLFRMPAARCHRVLPLQFVNLVTNYLTCVTVPFLAWLTPGEPLLFKDRCGDVLRVIDPLRKVWLITGAGSGIGRAVGRMLSDQGVRYIGVDRAFEGPPDSNSERVRIDLTAPNAISYLCDIVAKENVGVVVNNAGVGFRGAFSDLTVEQVSSTLEVNVEFPVKFAHAIMRMLVSQRGTLVNVASSMAGVPLPAMALYSATKGLLQAWSLGLAEEVAGKVTVLTLVPTGTATNFQLRAGVKGGQRSLMSPDRVAAAMVRSVMAGKRYCFVGSWRVRVVMWLCGLMPPSVQAKIWGFLFGRLR
jgi:nucleoside-diphosphate-sugar epimerase